MTMTQWPEADLTLKSISGRGETARAMSLLFLLRRWREKNAATITRPQPGDASNHSLASLAGGDLAERFHSWRGRSGRRYICSVFRVEHHTADSGLPDFEAAVVIAVKTNGDGDRHVVGFCQCEHGFGARARDTFVAAAIAAGAQQWHVHLLTADPQKRRAAIEDIESLCRSGRELQPV
jgi:hypothetical protein